MEQRRSQFDRDGLPAEAIRDPGSDPTTPVARGRRRAPARELGLGPGDAEAGRGEEQKGEEGGRKSAWWVEIGRAHV